MNQAIISQVIHYKSPRSQLLLPNYLLEESQAFHRLIQLKKEIFS